MDLYKYYKALKGDVFQRLFMWLYGWGYNPWDYVPGVAGSEGLGDDVVGYCGRELDGVDRVCAVDLYIVDVGVSLLPCGHSLRGEREEHSSAFRLAHEKIFRCMLVRPDLLTGQLVFHDTVNLHIASGESVSGE